MNSMHYTLFVGDLSIFCTEEDIRELFSTYGELLEVKIIRCEETKKNLSYGFVKYADTEAAVKAIEELNGTMLCGRPMRIGWASRRPRSEQYLGPSFNQSNERSSVHVTYSSFQIDNIVTEEYFVTTFSKYGTVIDAAVKRFEINEELHLQKGYGFVHFAFTPEGVAAAIKCCEEMHNATIDKVTYKCSISHRLKQSMGGGGHGSDAAQEEMYPEYAYQPMMMFNPLSMPQYPFGYADNPAAGMIVPVPVPLAMGMAAGLGEYPYLNPFLGMQAQGPVSTGGAAMLGMAGGGAQMGYPYSAGYSQPYPQQLTQSYSQAFPQVASLLAYQQQLQHAQQQQVQGGYSTSAQSASPYNNWYAPQSASISDPSQTDSDTGIAYEDTQYHAMPHSTSGTGLNAAAVAAAVHGDSPYMYTTLPNGSYANAADGSGGSYLPYPNFSLELPQAYAQAMANGTIPAASLGGGGPHPHHAPGHGGGSSSGKVGGGISGFSKGGGGSWASLFNSNTAAAQGGRDPAAYANGAHPKSRESRSHLIQHSHLPAAPTLMAFLPAALTAGAPSGANAARTFSGHGQGAVKTGQVSARGYNHGPNNQLHHTGEGSIVSAIRNRSKAARATVTTTSARPRGPENLDAEVAVVSPAPDPDAHSATRGAAAVLLPTPEADTTVPDLASSAVFGSSEATALDSASRAADLPVLAPVAPPAAPVNLAPESAVNKLEANAVLA